MKRQPSFSADSAGIQAPDSEAMVARKLALFAGEEPVRLAPNLTWNGRIERLIGLFEALLSAAVGTTVPAP